MPPFLVAALFLLGAPLAAVADGEVRVQPGDTLSSISLTYYGDVTHVEAIASYNELAGAGKIYAGQVLRLPDRAVSSPVVNAAPPVQGESVRVRPGDTLSSLSAAYYGDAGHAQAIADANRLSDLGHIEVGQTLVIPRGPLANGSIPMAQSGVATWYGPGFEGKTTKCGQVYRQWELSAASNDLPCGTVIEVTNLHNDRSVAVPVTDTGAFRHPNILDLSRGAFATLASTATGVIPVRLKVRSLPPVSRALR